jgi:hypothetical protein
MNRETRSIADPGGRDHREAKSDKYPLGSRIQGLHLDGLSADLR